MTDVPHCTEAVPEAVSASRVLESSTEVPSPDDEPVENSSFLRQSDSDPMEELNR